ncbi:MAG: sulfite exporter TauE/SafE family protein [Ilumatobacteraceae bacterium]
MTGVEWVVAVSAVAVGACAQGSLGFGLGMVAAPVLALTDPDFIPGPLLIVAMLLTLMVAFGERGGIDWKGLRWAIVGRVPGSVLGTAAVVVLPERGLIVLFAVLVLIGVGLSAAGWRVDPNRVSLFSAGAASGFMGSITSIGGPPMALLYQHRRGPELRATLAGFFVFGSTLSISLLLLAGEMGTADIGRAGILAPAMLLGFGASRRLAPYLDRGFMRPALLAFSAATSVLLLVIELF